jgi:hypothetical protein
MKLDTATLSRVITQCFDNSMDGRFSPEQRATFLTQGKRLRGLLLNLLSAQFDDGDQQVANANVELASVNSDLGASLADLTQVAATLDEIARLVGTLDGALGAVASFV